MLYTVSQLYERLTQKPCEVYEVFRNFFGEEYVDLQFSEPEGKTRSFIRTFLDRSLVSPVEEDGEEKYEVSDLLFKKLLISAADSKLQGIIYVWWPSVTVTNENDKSIIIQDLYAKIGVNLEGLIPYENRGFLLNRSTYTDRQFLSNYMHSHVQNIPKNNFSCFMPPCLGYGPIANTIGTLKNECSEVSWMLFCQELSMYVTVESIAGGPWKRLESVGSLHKSYDHAHFSYNQFPTYPSTGTVLPVDVVRSFIKYYLEHGHLSFCFTNGKYVCGMNYFDFIIDVSNAFISFYNASPDNVPCTISNLFTYKVLYRYTVSNGAFYTQLPLASSYDLSVRQDRYVLTFKGRNIFMRIIGSSEDNDSEVIVLNHNLSMYILQSILNIINYQYKNDSTNNSSSLPSSSDTPSSPAHERVCFL